MLYGGEEIFGHRAAEAGGDSEHVRDLFDGKLADIAPALAVDGEGERAERPLLGRHANPARRERRRHHAHLAADEAVEVRLPRHLRQPVDDALARAAAIERQHEAGRLGGAAKAPVPPEAEVPVPALGDGHALLDEIEGRIPDERAIGEDPEIAVAVGRRGGENGGDGLIVVGIGGRPIPRDTLRAGIGDLTRRAGDELRRQPHLPGTSAGHTGTIFLARRAP